MKNSLNFNKKKKRKRKRTRHLNGSMQLHLFTQFSHDINYITTVDTRSKLKVIK